MVNSLRHENEGSARLKSRVGAQLVDEYTRIERDPAIMPQEGVMPVRLELLRPF